MRVSRRELVRVMSIVPAFGTASAAAIDSGYAGPGLPQGARLPTLTFVYECDVTLSESLEFGPTLEGTRRIIPITGGSLKGPEIRGRVLSGGADWNLTRKDGARSVDASYYLQTDDSVIIRITNKGVGNILTTDPAPLEERFFMYTTPSFETPVGRYDWMTRSIFVGTLGARPNVKNAVLIRVFKVG